MFGSGISYLTVDLIRIWKSSDEKDFAEKRDRYLAAENPPDAGYYHQLDHGRMKEIVRFVDRCLDSVTPENEMKMEIYFDHDQPAFINDEVNTRLFNFTYADKVYRIMALLCHQKQGNRHCNGCPYLQQTKDAP